MSACFKAIVQYRQQIKRHVKAICNSTKPENPGLNPTRDAHGLYIENYKTLLRELRNKTPKQMKGHTMFMERKTILKMIISPKLT